MTKKENVKWIVQIIASVATAILTALGATSLRDASLYCVIYACVANFLAVLQ